MTDTKLPKRITEARIAALEARVAKLEAAPAKRFIKQHAVTLQASDFDTTGRRAKR